MIKGTIYKLYNTENEKYYIGSTIQKLNIRLNGHKYLSKIHHRNNGHKINSDLYNEMKLIDCNNWCIKSIEIIEIQNRKKLNEYENKHIDLNDKNCLNQISAYTYFNNSDDKEVIHKKQRQVVNNNYMSKIKENGIKYEYRKNKQNECSKNYYDKFKNNEDKYNEYLEKKKEYVKNKRNKLKEDNPEKYEEYLKKVREYKKNITRVRGSGDYDDLANPSLSMVESTPTRKSAIG
jgi:hypothetical protein